MDEVRGLRFKVQRHPCSRKVQLQCMFVLLKFKRTLASIATLLHIQIAVYKGFKPRSLIPNASTTYSKLQSQTEQKLRPPNPKPVIPKTLQPYP